MSKIKRNYKALSFSTNIKDISLCSLLKLFLSNKLCSKIKEKNNHCLEYDYLIDDKILVHTTLFEVYELNKKIDISYLSDSYIIIIDLEKDDSYEKLESIILYIINYCDLEKKIFVLGVYKNVNNINEDLKEENIKDYIDNKRINYEYLELNIENQKDLIKIIEFITKQSILNNNMHNDSYDKDKGQSNSGCNIF